MPKIGVWIEKDTISPALAYAVTNVSSEVTERTRQAAHAVEQDAKANAPWADRTGAARAGLYADVYEEGGEIVLELGHSVDYGQWLELIQDGQYAIILPTLEKMASSVMQAAGGGLFPGMGGDF